MSGIEIGTPHPNLQENTRQLPVPRVTRTIFDSTTNTYREISVRKNEFDDRTRWLVRHEQRFRCAYCGTKCRGHEKGEPFLQIHHVVPISKGGSSDRSNAVGLCNTECHPLFDALAIEDGITIHEVFMSEGREYEITNPEYFDKLWPETPEMISDDLLLRSAAD